MLKSLCVSLLCCYPLAACNSVPAADETSTSPSGFTDNTPAPAAGLLVSFNADVSEATARAIITQQGAQVIKTFRQPGLFHISIPESTTGTEMIKRLENMPQVRYAEINNTRQRTR